MAPSSTNTGSLSQQQEGLEDIQVALWCLCLETLQCEHEQVKPAEKQVDFLAKNSIIQAKVMTMDAALTSGFFAVGEDLFPERWQSWVCTALHEHVTHTRTADTGEPSVRIQGNCACPALGHLEWIGISRA